MPNPEALILAKVAFEAMERGNHQEALSRHAFVDWVDEATLDIAAALERHMADVGTLHPVYRITEEAKDE